MVGTFGGYRFAGVNESKRDERATEREDAARLEARAELREQSRHEFQLATVLDLQDVIRELARATGSILVADENSLSTGGRYLQVPDKLKDHAYSGRRDLIRLMHRMTNDTLRLALDDFNNLTASMIVVGRNLDGIDPQRELERKLQSQSDLARLFADINEKLRVHLRAVLDWRPIA